MATIVDRDLTGSHVSRYVVTGAVAAGGMGQVYLGRDDDLRRYVAIKVLRDDGPSSAIRARLLTEARLQAQLNHPSVAGVYDFVEQDGRAFLIMEFVPGATLREILVAGPLPDDEVVRIGIQLASGLAAAHAVGVVHRDLKPQNLRVTPAGRLKIVDFGIADFDQGNGVADESADTHTARHAGTVPYMSPEHLRGQTTDGRSDIFSAGAVLYEMTTGCRAFPQRNLVELVDAILHECPPAPTALNPLTSATLETVILRALHKEPARRFQSAAVFAEALRAVRKNRRCPRIRTDLVAVSTESPRHDAPPL
jgi:serine/threonine protein kinase